MSVFIVAEAGINHLGDRAKMLALCDAAKQAGADAVKFQAYNAIALCKRRGSGDFGLLKKCELSDADLDAIAAHCTRIGIKWFASVFDPSQVERVLSRGACALKIGHAEAEYWRLVITCHGRGVPVWTSGKGGNVVGVWTYPAPIGKTALSRLNGIDRQGYSSHHADYRIPAAAALRGAEYIEAHLKLGPRQHWPEEERGYTVPQWIDDEPEAAWSLNLEDFGKMVKLIREYEGWL